MSQLLDRRTEIKKWVEDEGKNLNCVTIHDNLSINGLPAYINERWVATIPFIGFDREALEKALLILAKNSST